MRSYVRILICIVTILVCPVLSHADWAFDTEPVTREQYPRDFQPGQVLIDSTGNPHFLVRWNGQMGNVPDSLIHRYFTGQVWAEEWIGSTSGEIAFAMDARDRKHIVYQEGAWPMMCMPPPCPPANIVHAYHDGTNWSFTNIGTWEMSSPSMVIDRSSIPHLAYSTPDPQNSSIDQLKYAKFINNQWVTKTIAGGAIIFGNSIAVTKTGQAHVVYTKAVNDPELHHLVGTVWWATNSSGVWRSRQIAAGFSYKIILDTQEHPYVVFRSNNTEDVLLTRFDGQKWSAQNVMSAIGLTGTGMYPDILFDPEGHINVFFINSIPDKDTVGSYTYIPVHAHFDGKYWVKDFFDPSVKQCMTLSAARHSTKIDVLYTDKVDEDITNSKWAYASDVRLVAVKATDPAASRNGHDPGKFTIMRTGKLTAPLTVYYSIGGTARNGVDYQHIDKQVSIPAESSAIDIDIMPFGNQVVTGTKTVRVDLTQTPYYRVTLPSSARVTISGN